MFDQTFFRDLRRSGRSLFFSRNRDGLDTFVVLLEDRVGEQRQDLRRHLTPLQLASQHGYGRGRRQANDFMIDDQRTADWDSGIADCGFPLSPCPLVSLSPCLLVSLSSALR